MAVIPEPAAAPLRPGNGGGGGCRPEQPALAGACSSHFDRVLLDLAAHPNRFQVHAAAALRLRKLLRHRTEKAEPPAVTLAAGGIGLLSQPVGEEATDASDGERTPSTAGLNTTDDEEEGEQEEVAMAMDEPALSPGEPALACHRLIRRPSRSRWSRGITVDTPLPKAASVEAELASTAGSSSQDQDALPPPQTTHSSPQMKTMQREGRSTCWHELDEPFGGQGGVPGLGAEQSPMRLALFEPRDSGSGRLATAGADTTSASSGNLRLIPGAFGVPHPEKAKHGGADSFFASPHSGSMGIADGVGEWEWRFGINARNFADELMAGCLDSLEVQKDDGLRMKSEARALQAFREGYTWTRSFGSSTATVAVLGPGSSGSSFAELGVANLGDSALLVLRRQEVAAGSGLLRCVARTREQQHSFNCPYQLSLLPTEVDFPELIRQGKEKLVRGLANKPLTKQDMPEDAELYTFSVQEGDLIIMGTDGVFDNLYVQEICQLVRFAVPPSEAQASLGGEPGVDELTDPGQIATTIVTAAFHRSMDRSARTPFSDHARQAGFYHTGGKMDDITCVCAWITAAAADDGGAAGASDGDENFFDAAAQE